MAGILLHQQYQYRNYIGRNAISLWQRSLRCVCVFFFYLDQSNLQSKQQKKRMSVFNEHCLQ